MRVKDNMVINIEVSDTVGDQPDGSKLMEIPDGETVYIGYPYVTRTLGPPGESFADNPLYVVTPVSEEHSHALYLEKLEAGLITADGRDALDDAIDGAFDE